MNDNYKGLSESEIRELLEWAKIVKVPEGVDGHSVLIVRGAGMPGLVVCMLDQRSVCLIAYMFA